MVKKKQMDFQSRLSNLDRALVKIGVGLRQDNSFVSVALGSVLGSCLHVVFDSFMYRDIMPFYPFDYNPFYGIFSPPETRLLCVACFGGTVILYAVKLMFGKKNTAAKITAEDTEQ